VLRYSTKVLPALNPNIKYAETRDYEKIFVTVRGHQMILYPEKVIVAVQFFHRSAPSLFCTSSDGFQTLPTFPVILLPDFLLLTI